MEGYEETGAGVCANLSVCLQAKPDRSAYPGKLQPVHTPQEAWHIVPLDFIECLPKSGNSDCILVVVDKFTRYGHFIPLSHPYTTSTIAMAFLNEVYRLHGLPSAIISDRDPVFTSKFWRSLFKLAGIKLKLSSSYHPQTDGQTECVNQCLETYLRCFVHSCPKKWKL
jgi:transposase InsO family protein